MGLLSVVMKAIGFGDQLFQDEGDKRENAQRVANGVRELLQGAITMHDGGAEVHVDGGANGRAVRVVLSVDFGSIQVEAATASPHPSSLHMLHFDHEGRGPRQLGQAVGEQRLYLARAVYAEGEQHELAELQARLARLGQPVMHKLLAHLEATQAGAMFQAGRVTLSPWKGDLADSSCVRVIQGHVAVACELATAIDYAWR